MTKLTNDIIDEILTAMGNFHSIAQQLINKLINETDQPKKTQIELGHYYEIQNADILNGQVNLSDNWTFDVHGEHCLFKNSTTGQTLEVSLGDKDSVANLDPYFFYTFLKTTENLKHLIKYFDNPFKDMLFFFEELEKQKILAHIYGAQYRKITSTENQ